MKDKITELLTTALNYIYCHNCDSSDLPEDNEDYGCGDCHRKSMGWALSKSSAEEIAGKILKEISEDPYEVVINHTDPTEIKTALALAVKQLARVEKLNKAMRKALKECLDLMENTLEYAGEPIGENNYKFIETVLAESDKQLKDVLMPDKGATK